MPAEDAGDPADPKGIMTSDDGAALAASAVLEQIAPPDATAVASGQATADVDAEIKRLQARKLTLEVEELERPWWRSKDVIGLQGSVLIGLLGLAATTVLGFYTTAERIEDSTRRQLVSEAIGELNTADARQRAMAGRRLALLDERFNFRELKKAYERSASEGRNKDAAEYRTPYLRVGAVEAIGQNFRLWRSDPDELATFLRGALQDDPSVLVRHKAMQGLVGAGQLGVAALKVAYEEDKTQSARRVSELHVFGGTVIGVPEGWAVVGLDHEFDVEGPAIEHKVKAFWIDALPVSNGQWNAHMKSQPSDLSTPHAERIAYPDRKKMLQEARLNPQHAALPVVGVSLAQAQRYCEVTGMRRLPSQAEWEVAARGRIGWIYPWGTDEAPAAKALKREADRKVFMKAKGGPSFPHTQALSKPIDEDVSPFKVAGLVSSVRQWTQSEWTTRQISIDDERVCSSTCVLKGSAGVEDEMYAHAWRFRPTRRTGVSIAHEPYSDDNVGFRCVSAAKPT